MSLKTQRRLFQSDLQEGRKGGAGEEERERRSGRVGEGRTETKALNLARCDIPEKNNTASPCCCEWRKAEGEGGTRGGTHAGTR